MNNKLKIDFQAEYKEFIAGLSGPARVPPAQVVNTLIVKKLQSHDPQTVAAALVASGLHTFLKIYNAFEVHDYVQAVNKDHSIAFNPDEDSNVTA